jgi:hypothetical protein
MIAYLLLTILEKNLPNVLLSFLDGLVFKLPIFIPTISSLINS